MPLPGGRCVKVVMHSPSPTPSAQPSPSDRPDTVSREGQELPETTETSRSPWPWFLGGFIGAGDHRDPDAFVASAIGPDWLPSAPCRACDVPPPTSRAGPDAGRQGLRLPRRGRASGSPRRTSSGSRDLVIPPAWEDVWICPYANGHLQAVGTDDAGRRQYLYHPDWRAKRDPRSSTRMPSSARRWPRPAAVVADLGREGMPLERACAAAVRLLDLGYFRIGNDVYADDNGQLRADHAGAPARAPAAGPAGLRLRRQVGGRARDRDRRRDGHRGDRDHAAPARRRRPAAVVQERALVAVGAARPGQRVRARLHRARGDRQGLPHLARDGARGRGARRDATSRARPRRRASGRSAGR